MPWRPSFLVLLALAACGRGVDSAVEAGPDGLRLVLPAGWSCSSTAGDAADRLVCTEEGRERLSVISSRDARDGQVEGTEASARALEGQLELSGFTTVRSRVFLDGHFVVRHDYSGADASGTWWTVLSTETARLFQIHLQGGGTTTRDLVEGLRFTAAYPVLYESGALAVTARDAGGLGVLAVGLFLLIALGRKLVLDLPRVFTDPGGLFGDFGRGETIWFPAAVVLCSAFLLTGTLALFESQYMGWAFAEQVEPLTDAIRSTVMGHRYVQQDAELAAMVLSGVRAGSVDAWSGFFSMALWLLPLVWLGMWIANGTAIFLGGKAVKGEAIWTRSFFAAALLAGPSAMLWGGLALALPLGRYVDPGVAIAGWVVAGLGALALMALGMQGLANLMRVPSGQAPVGWLVARVVWAIALGTLLYQGKAGADATLGAAARPDYDEVKDLRIF